MSMTSPIRPPFQPRSSSLTKPAKVGAHPCTRCGGAGGFDGWPGFTCYRCGGSGSDPTQRQWMYPATYTDEQVQAHVDMLEARNQRARERALEKKLAKAAEQLVENVAKYPVLGEVDTWVKANGWTGDGFLNDLLSKGRQYPLTEKQAAAMAKAWDEFQDFEARRAEREAAEALVEDLPEGTYDIVATVVSKKWVDNEWGGQLKMVVSTDAGQRIWGTVPRAIADDLGVGDRVAFTATVTRSEDDRLFGFFSRPRSAVVLERAPDA